MFKFDYTICPENSVKIFKEICEKLEQIFPNLKKDDLLIDVDGSTIQMYKKEDKRIVVYDDYEVGAVYIKSDIKLEGI